MSQKRQYLSNKYKQNDYVRECDVCGLRYTRNDMRKRWDGAIVCDKDYEFKPDNMKKRQKSLETPYTID